ncbi:hypothetical protein JTB14_004905 [Gonioctena quinquepunctata]|nr:hypothetical protein JTB14_004905 [Gonioctena quinquepunctata]
MKVTLKRQYLKLAWQSETWPGIIFWKEDTSNRDGSSVTSESVEPNADESEKTKNKIPDNILDGNDSVGSSYMTKLKISQTQKRGKYWWWGTGKTNKEHGGIAIFGNNKIKTKPINLSDITCELEGELCAIEIVPNIILKILKIYCSRIFQWIIVVGDFNINFKGSSNEINNFKDLIFSFGLRAIIDEYTRVTATSRTCLDNITNIDEQFLLSGVIEPGIADHRAQYLTLKTKSTPKLYINQHIKDE